jgi:hypothetical protein
MRETEGVLAAQVDGFMRQNNSANVSEVRVSVAVRRERERCIECELCSMVVVWRREVHVGNERWSGAVHESDTGK